MAYREKVKSILKRLTEGDIVEVTFLENIIPDNIDSTYKAAEKFLGETQYSDCKLVGYLYNDTTEDDIYLYLYQYSNGYEKLRPAKILIKSIIEINLLRG